MFQYLVTNNRKICVTLNQSFSSSWKISSACLPKYLAIFSATMVEGI